MPNLQQKSHGPTTRMPGHPMRDQLPDLAAVLARGGVPGEALTEMIAHVRGCAECQVELDDLLEMLELIYAGGLDRTDAHPGPDLSFLRPAPAREYTPTMPWQVNADRLTISFSDMLLQTIRQPALAGSARGQLLYRYTQEPGSVADLHVAIEIFAEDTARGAGRVRVSVDVPSRGPLDQSGSRVLLHAGDLNLAGDTDESGTVDFVPVPLAALPELRVEIAPSEAPV